MLEVTLDASSFLVEMFMFSRKLFFSPQRDCVLFWKFWGKALAEVFWVWLSRSCSVSKWLFPLWQAKLRTSVTRTDLFCHQETLWGALQRLVSRARQPLLPEHGLGQRPDVLNRLHVCICSSPSILTCNTLTKYSSNSSFQPNGFCIWNEMKEN